MRESYILQVKETAETELVVKKLRDVLAWAGIEVEYLPVQKSIKFNFDTSKFKRKQPVMRGERKKRII